jgi:methylmalonyl-CoA/ethylmalonyl-CoA epimerase
LAVASKAAARTKRSSKPAKKPSRPPAAKATKTAARTSVSAKSTKSPARAPAAARAPSAPARPRPRSGNGQDFQIERLHQVALQATNLDAAVNFYRDVLGLRFIVRFDPPGLAFFDMGGFRLLLSATASGATLYFRVVDIDDAVKSLKKRGVSFLHPPAMIQRDETGEFGKKGVEEWMAFFKDPSGNILALTERR